MKEIISSSVPDFIEKNKKIFYQHFDPKFAEGLLKNVISVLDANYFRTKYIGPETLPQRNNPKHPLIYISNHSGMAFPWDAIILVAKFYQVNKMRLENSVRALSAPMLSASRLMNPFMVENFWWRVGCIDATMENFETMMHQEKWNILIYPEGVPGIAKGFDKRYQVQQFSTSFLRMSIKYQTDVQFVATVNAEYINPYSYHSKFVNKLVQKIGIPFIPVSILTPLILIQPWFFYFGFPANLTYVIGPRLQPYKMLPKPIEKIRKPELRELRDEIQSQFQKFLNSCVEQYGQDPYDFINYLEINLRNPGEIFYSSPSGWPVLFSEYERRFVQKEGDEKIKLGLCSYLQDILKNPFTIFYYIPILGLIPLIIRGYSQFQLNPTKEEKE